MADEDPYIKLAGPLARPAENPNKFYVHFMYKAAVVAVFIVFLPLLPSQAPEFINQTLHTRSWEFLQLLFVGIAVSYGLFSRKNDESEKDQPAKPDNTHSYVSRFLEVSSVFEDEADNSSGPEDNSKVQTWSSQYYREKPRVVVAQEGSIIEDRRRIRAGPNEKPLLLPVRSLKSRVSDSDFALEAKELSGTLRRSSSFSTSRSFDQSRNGQSGAPDAEENVVLRSPIPWRSRSGRMEMKVEMDNFTLPSPMEESNFRPFESNSYRPQNTRSPRPSSTPPTPNKLSPSPSLSPPKKEESNFRPFESNSYQPQNTRSPRPSSTPPMPNKLSPSPSLSPPKKEDSDFRSFESNSYRPQNTRSPRKEDSDFRSFESNSYRPQNTRSSRPSSTPPTPKKLSPSPSLSPPKKLPPSTATTAKNTAEEASRNVYYRTTPPPPPPPPPQPLYARKPPVAEEARRNVYYRTTPPPPPPPPPQPLYARKPPVAKSYSSMSSSASSSGKELKRTIRSVPSYPKEPEVVPEQESKNRIASSVRTVRAVESVASVEPSYPHMSEAAFLGYEKEEFDQSEESEDESEIEKEEVVEEEASSPTSGGEGGPDVNQKADEFIAKFREQIRLQRIESIKRSTAQIARNSSR